MNLTAHLEARENLDIKKSKEELSSEQGGKGVTKKLKLKNNEIYFTKDNTIANVYKLVCIYELFEIINSSAEALYKIPVSKKYDYKLFLNTKGEIGARFYSQGYDNVESIRKLFKDTSKAKHAMYVKYIKYKFAFPNYLINNWDMHSGNIIKGDNRQSVYAIDFEEGNFKNLGKIDIKMQPLLKRKKQALHNYLSFYLRLLKSKKNEMLAIFDRIKKQFINDINATDASEESKASAIKELDNNYKNEMLKNINDLIKFCEDKLK